MPGDFDEYVAADGVILALPCATTVPRQNLQRLLRGVEYTLLRAQPCGFREEWRSRKINLPDLRLWNCERAALARLRHCRSLGRLSESSGAQCQRQALCRTAVRKLWR